MFKNFSFKIYKQNLLKNSRTIVYSEVFKFKGFKKLEIVDLQTNIQHIFPIVNLYFDNV